MMKIPKKITFVYPGISSKGFSNPEKGMDTSWISHGLCLLSAILKKQKWNVELIDLRLLHSWQEFKTKIREDKSLLYGFTALSVDFDPTVKAVKIIKKIKPQAKVFVGGPHATLVPEEFLKVKEIDYILTGEGEKTFPKILNLVRNGKKIKRLIAGEKPNLDKLPFGDRELFSNQEWPIHKGLKRPFVTIIAGRGCRYNCSFCKPAEDLIFGRPVRRRSVENVIKELIYLRNKSKFKSLLIHDDCLLEDKLWVEDFCRLYRRQKLKAPFVCQGRVDLIVNNENLIKKMVQAGLYMLMIGFESGNQRVLNFIRKGTTVEQNLKAGQICKKYGIKIWANFILGLPTETNQEVMETVKMIKKIKPEVLSPSFFTPHPGSDLYDYCRKHKLTLIKSHDQYNRGQFTPKIKGPDYVFLKKVIDDLYRQPIWYRGLRKLSRILGIEALD